MTKELKPSLEQLAVIESSSNSVIVTAAAGAGKTRVLVERYLRHVMHEGLRPDQILTITFTKKAAAEMKKRIVQDLRKSDLLEAAQIAETGPIQTIHSFCERMLRENSLESGLDPEFEILSESESSRMVLECVRDALASPLDSEPHAEALVSFLAGQRRYGQTSPYAKLEKAITDVLDGLRSSRFKIHEIQDWHQDPDTLLERWNQVLLEAAPEKVRLEFLATDGESFQARLKTAYKSATNKVPSWLNARSADPEADAEAARHTCGLVQLACAAWWRLVREMDTRQALDFTELEARAVRLLADSEVTRLRIRDQYRVAMIDEAQDLNPIQNELLSAMNIERELVVGDAQQSIYGFRQADVELFEARKQSGALTLSKNYRSKPTILNFVDDVFSTLWSDRYVPMAAAQPSEDPEDYFSDRSYEGVELWRLAAKDTRGLAGYIGQLLEEGVQKSDIALLVRDSNYAVQIQTALDVLGIESQIVGGSQKFYTRLEVRDLSNALRSVADPLDDFSLLACLHSPMVGLSMDSVILLASMKNVAEHIVEFVPPIEEDKPKLERFLGWYVPLRKFADRLSAWEVLAEIFAKSDYLQALARREGSQQRLANVRKLLGLAAQLPELGPLEYAERVREIQNLQHKEGDAPAGMDDANVVTIMTIHKAKGLEFPVVIIPQTNEKLTRKASDLVIDPRLGLATTKYGKSPGLFYKFLTDRKKERDREEELRVLYVALTRPQSRLCVCTYPPSNDDTISKRINAIFGESARAGLVVRDIFKPEPANSGWEP